MLKFIHQCNRVIIDRDVALAVRVGQQLIAAERNFPVRSPGAIIPAGLMNVQSRSAALVR